MGKSWAGRRRERCDDAGGSPRVREEQWSRAGTRTQDKTINLREAQRSERAEAK